MPGYVPRFEGKEIGDTFDQHARMGMDMSVSLQFHSVGFVVVSRGAESQMLLWPFVHGCSDVN